MKNKKLGYVVSGSLVEGLVMRLESEFPLEELKTGKFVTILGKKHKFFSLITDIELQVTNPEILLFPPEEDEAFLTSMLKKRDAFALIKLRPMLMIDEKNNHIPVKTIPSHFTDVFSASSKDVALIFGDEKEERFFNIGVPLDMKTPVCLNLDSFIERSNGIFGKTGTGKTFITRLILAGLVKNNKAVNLIFDMHSEYGFQARKEGIGQNFVKGLKTLFPDKVAIFSLDPESTRKRGGTPDIEVVLSLQDIKVEDVLTLQNELNLHSTALEAAYLIYSKYKHNWLKALLEQDGTIKEFAEGVGAHAESIGALYRKLKRLERFSFLQKTKSDKPVVDDLINHLQSGKHVILEFGNNTSLLCYLLVSNIITRKIHKAYVAQTEKFLSSQKVEDAPKHLMITIEEAHKFLNVQSARQTIFGVIAREMRKYNVSLLVVDQRPSGIDPEIISQIGTKIIAQLNDEKDIHSVLIGASNISGLRSILATLDSKKQALLLGHAVPMPVVIQTREYDDVFYGAMGHFVDGKRIEETIEEIF